MSDNADGNIKDKDHPFYDLKEFPELAFLATQYQTICDELKNAETWLDIDFADSLAKRLHGDNYG